MIVVAYPTTGVNDDRGALRWLVPTGTLVRAGEELAEGETSKSTFPIVSPGDGYLRRVKEEGEALENEIIGVLTATPDEEFVLPGQSPELAGPPPVYAGRWTVKAELVAGQLGLDIRTIPVPAGELITEAVVRAYAQSPRPGVSPRSVLGNRALCRVIIIGAGSFGEVVASILASQPGMVPVGYLDDQLGKQMGYHVVGLPVLGTISDLERVKRAGLFDKAIISVGRPRDRERLYTLLTESGVEFANAIHPRCHIEPSAVMGTGNIIAATASISYLSKIGDNNIISNGVVVEHHNSIGSHNLFGPNSATSGRVVIGNTVLVGAGCLFEPRVSVGDHAVIASGNVVRQQVADNEIIRGLR